MAQSVEEKIFQAIIKDDIKAFNALNETVRCGAYRLGRFPVLSLMYLYKARRILTVYEEKFLKITNFELVHEPVEVAKSFSQKAGKCLRLYLDEVVSPLEMLLILDKTRRLKRVYPMTKPSSAVKERLVLIYSIKYSLNVQFKGEEIVIDRRPLSYREKKNIATICLCLVLAVTAAVGVPVTTVALIPKHIEGEVTKLSHIDFSSQEEYTLKRDLVLPANYSVEKVNCKINGEGHKLILSKGATLGEFNGTLSDLTIESSGDAIFTSVAEKATIENITVNVSACVATAESTAFIALTNYGTIDGITVNVSGSINALAPTQTTEEPEELPFGGIVLNNAYKSQKSFGTVKNCTVNYSQFSLCGEVEANAVFGGVVGVNSAYVQDCTVTGEIISDTFDIAGVCAINNYLLSGNVNAANLSQTSSGASWNPITCGIVMLNAYAVEKCVNKGIISSVSDSGNSGTEGSAPTVSAAGIVSTSYGYIYCSVNEGEIFANGCGTAYIGGIAAQSYTQAIYCVSSGNITATSQTVYAGGIFGASEVYDFYNFGIINFCISESKITVSGDVAYVGGIAGCINEKGFDNYDGSVIYSGGGVTYSFFLGEYEFESDELYFGNIVGLCGANIFDRNYYVFNGYYNFYGNCYLENDFTAFGAKVTADENYSLAEDKEVVTASNEDIENSEVYQYILSELQK